MHLPPGEHGWTDRQTSQDMESIVAVIVVTLFQSSSCHGCHHHCLVTVVVIVVIVIASWLSLSLSLSLSLLYHHCSHHCVMAVVVSWL